MTDLLYLLGAAIALIVPYGIINANLPRRRHRAPVHINQGPPPAQETAMAKDSMSKFAKAWKPPGERKDVKKMSEMGDEPSEKTKAKDNAKTMKKLAKDAGSAPKDTTGMKGDPKKMVGKKASAKRV